MIMNEPSFSMHLGYNKTEIESKENLRCTVNFSKRSEISDHKFEI